MSDAPKITTPKDILEKHIALNPTLSLVMSMAGTQTTLDWAGKWGFGDLLFLKELLDMKIKEMINGTRQAPDAK